VKTARSARGIVARRSIGEDFIPPIADLSGGTRVSITDAQSFAAARELLAKDRSSPAPPPGRCSPPH